MDFQWLTEGSIIQAGGVVVALVAIFAMIYMVQKFTKILGNHMEHEVSAREKEAESRDRFSEKFVELVETIKNHFDK